MKSNLRVANSKLMFLVVIVCSGLFLWVGCPSEESSTGPVTPDCQKYNTAKIYFENRSSNSTYDVILDGVRIGSIGTGQSMSRTVAAGEHTILFRFANLSSIACSQAHPNLATCECETYYCTNDL